MQTILLVEDTDALAEMYLAKLQMNGFEIIVAKDGEEGLHLALQEHPNIILLDVRLPKMDGMTVMKNLREDVWGKNVPIIFLTNVSPDATSTINAIVEHKPAYYLIKDRTTPQDIVDKVREILEHS